MGKKKSLIYEAVERFDSLMAIGDKRSEAKAAAHARGESVFGFSDGKIRSHRTRTVYQDVVMRFLHWCRDSHALTQLAQVDAHAEELVSTYLPQRMDEQKSAWTLKTERSALRCFFQNRTLAESVDLPKRRQQDIVLSRRSDTVRSKNFQPDNWQPLIRFVLTCGARRKELRNLRARDISPRWRDQHLVVTVLQGKGGKRREIPVFPGREQDVLQVVEGLTPDDRIFPRLPGNMRFHAYRRQFAQELYVHHAGKPIPPERPLRRADLDLNAVLTVSRALGHNRIDVVITHYLQ